ncbi:unnamed protein product [Symbiodinium natans]|uniref:Prolyl 4-hydroxylase alpha subunit Fe(2+) 2OG dioxygenase domain-containing protein n=1 Tax=Symbiodinium natans TaxID=878477 RepID=A0A812RR66_9DINO|nr:unnamed protein product [Symbiodinium natans]
MARLVPCIGLLALVSWRSFCDFSLPRTPRRGSLASRRALQPDELPTVAAPGGSLPNGELREAYEPEMHLDAREGRVEIFPSPIYRRKIRPSNEEVRALNDEIVLNFRRIMARDEKGIEYSKTHYAGGYTSYFSLPALQGWVPPIQTLEEWLRPHIQEFTQHALLQDGPELFMTDCWANVMGDGTEHMFHQHKKSTISGTYYVQTPRGCSGLLFEDPRLDRTVAKQSRRVVEFPAIAGFVVLFESWQRHKVPPNCGDGERISVSFNYHWRYEEPTKIPLE